ncbi:MAG TPA: hypothetical protein VN937_20190 [Blastocatellia bacterium]|nr:hypothetical protein [Blastocatellia bacterium]
MAQRGRSSEKVKRIALGVLGLVLVVVFVYEVFLSGPSPRPKLTPQAGSSNSGTTLPLTASAPSVSQKRPTGAAAEQEALVQAMLSDLTPLRFVSNAGGKSEVGSRGNIFAFYVAPPPPPIPPPPPPPIQLTAVQPQSLVAGTPRPVTVLVSGNKIPADAQVFFNGGPRATKRVSETQLSVDITPGDYASQQNINIDVKSQSNPAENSNALVLVVQAAPEPGFIYKGRLGPLNQPQANYAVFELNATKEIKRAKVGDTVMGVWRVDAILADSVDITQTQYDIKRRLPLQDKVR